MTDAVDEGTEPTDAPPASPERRGKTVHGEAANAGHRVLAPDDANFDLTYGKEPGGFGPDEVGSHPASRSPFGVDDLAGNAFEWTRSSVEPDRPVARGGSYYFAAATARSANREMPERTFRDINVGIRVCADLPTRTVPTRE